MAETTAWRSHCQFITFITFLFTVNVIRQMAPLFSKVDSNKLWHDVQNKENVIYAEFGKDLFNISKVISRKKVAQFFLTHSVYTIGLLYSYEFLKLKYRITPARPNKTRPNIRPGGDRPPLITWQRKTTLWVEWSLKGAVLCVITESVILILSPPSKWNEWQR